MTAPVPATPLTDQLAWVRAQEEQTHRNRRRTNILVTWACVATLAVVAYSYVDLGDRIDKVLTIARNATGPKQQAAATAFRNQVVGCVNNHTDRALAVIFHVPEPATAANCPTSDSLAAPAPAAPAGVSRPAATGSPAVTGTTRRAQPPAAVASPATVCAHPGKQGCRK